MKPSFNDHQYRLCLDRKLYSAVIRLQAAKGLGKSYSALLPFVEGLHLMGYLDDADYEVYRNKYSVSLEEASKTPTQIIREEKRHNKYRQLNRHYSEALKQWSTLSDKSKAVHLKKAAEHSHLKNARLLLDLANTSLEVP